MKFSLKDFALAAIIATAAFVPTQTATAELYGGPSRGEAVVFKDPGFRGEALVIRGAEPNLAEIRFNDTISSIELSGTWELCVDPNFRGRCQIVDGSVPHLSQLRLNDNITSLRPIQGRRSVGTPSRRDVERDRGARRGFSDAIVLFRDPEFRGAPLGINRAIRDLKDVNFNDTASSIEINSGRWLVCEHPDFRGRCEVIDGNVWNLRDVGLDDRITSLRPFDGRADRGRSSDRFGSYGYQQPRTVGYGRRDQRPDTFQFDRPRDFYGDRIPARHGNADQFCRDNGFRRAIEVEARGRYLDCVVCAR